MKTSLKNLKYRIRILTGSYQWLFLIFSMFIDKKLVINRKTELVIEGFPRSGNTYCVYAFQTAQEKDRSIAHHSHQAGQVIKGIRMGLPVLVLIRNPFDAIKSLLLRYPEINARSALYGYYRFYDSLMPYKKNVLVVPFEQLIRDFKSVIEGLNRKFNTRFRIQKLDRTKKIKIMELIKRADLKNGKGESGHLSFPSLEKEKQKRKINLFVNRDLTVKVTEVYQAFMDGC